MALTRIGSVISSAISSIDFEKSAAFVVIEVQDSAQAISAAESWSENQKIRGGEERIVILRQYGPTKVQVQRLF